MKTNTVLRAKVKQGRIVYADPLQFSKVLSALNGKDVDAVYKEHKNARSYRQNRYYWGIVVNILSDVTGYSSDEMHEILRAKFLPDSKEVGNEVINISRSTTELNTSEFEDYLRQIREFASASLGTYIPQPNECEY
ncbi:MAG: hypothetical protein PHF74_05710 [Dehalococcoidales bacterium]|nr:hypothetical protein [Dehalococcoidales bacterium]